MPPDEDSMALGQQAEEPQRKYIAYGEYIEVEDHDGSMVRIEKAYPEPRIVDGLAPNQRGNLLPEED